MKRLTVILLAGLAVAALVYVLLSISDDDAPSPAAPPENGSPRAARGEQPVPELPDGKSLVARRDEVPPYPYEVPAWKREMARNLDEAVLALDVREVYLVDLLAEIRPHLPYPIELDRGAKMKRKRLFTFRVRKLRASALLQTIERRSGLDLYFTPGLLHFTSPELTPTPTGPEAVLLGIERAKKLLEEGGRIRPALEKLLPIRIVDDSVWRAATKVGVRLMVQVEVDADLDKERRQKKLTLSADTFTATQVLDHISEEVGLSWAVEDRRIVLCEPARAYDLRQRTARIGVLAEKEVHLNYRNRPLHQVVSDLAKQIEAPVHVERSLWEPDHPRVSLDVDAEQLRWALEDLCEAVGARHLIDADAVYLLSP
ncbi:MAG: hypothetical protein ACYTDY_04875 [Planctomycetota bacterium]